VNTDCNPSEQRHRKTYIRHCQGFYTSWRPVTISAFILPLTHTPVHHYEVLELRGSGQASMSAPVRLLGIAGQGSRLAVLAQIPTFHDLARQGMSDHAFGHLGAVDQFVQIDSGLDAHLLAHEHDVLGAHIP
jgi:hypothetical protein